jgi:IS605 OrfB family transposase
MTHTITIETRIEEEDLSSNIDNALSRISHSFQQAKRVMFSQKMRGISITKPQFCARYGLSSRQFNSVKQDVDAIFKSQTSNLKRYIEEDFARFDNVIKHLKRYQKKLQSHANNQTILSPNEHVKTVERKRGCERKKQIIVSRIARREALLEDEKVSICFGSKALFGKQHNLKENEYKGHQEWLGDFQSARSDEYYSKGAKDEVNGNQSVTITQNPDGSCNLRVRALNGLEAELGQYISIDNLVFSYKGSFLDAAVSSNKERVEQWRKGNRENLLRRHKTNILTLQEAQIAQTERMQARGAAAKDISDILTRQRKKLERFKNETKNNLLADFGQALSYRFKKDGKGWRVLISVPVLEAEQIMSDKNNGAIGVDLNERHVSATYISSKGNKVWSKDIYFREGELITSKVTETKLAEAVKWISDQAKELAVPVFIENLDFKKAKAAKSNNKRFNKIVSSLITSKFKALMTLRCFEKGVELDTVNPAYTSFLGRLKYGSEFEHNTHQAAAMMIARRGLDLKDNHIPAVCVVKIKRTLLRFRTPEDVLKKDVIGKLKSVKREFDSWCKQQYRTIEVARLAPPDEPLAVLPF